MTTSPFCARLNTHTKKFKTAHEISELNISAWSMGILISNPNDREVTRANGVGTRRMEHQHDMVESQTARGGRDDHRNRKRCQQHDHDHMVKLGLNRHRHHRINSKLTIEVGDDDDDAG